MNRELLTKEQAAMRARHAVTRENPGQRNGKGSFIQQHSSPDCPIPLKWRWTVTIALRSLIDNMHRIGNEAGCKRSLECARDIGLDVDLVAKYTHLENSQEVPHAK